MTTLVRERVDFDSAHVAIGFAGGYILTASGETPTPMRVVIEEATGIPEAEYWELEVVGYHDDVGLTVMSPFHAALGFASLPAGKIGIRLHGATMERDLPEVSPGQGAGSSAATGAILGVTRVGGLAGGRTDAVIDDDGRFVGIRQRPMAGWSGALDERALTELKDAIAAVDFDGAAGRLPRQPGADAFRYEISNGRRIVHVSDGDMAPEVGRLIAAATPILNGHPSPRGEPGQDD
jgi:hypothetical protein